jgi:hypothetical protein
MIWTYQVNWEQNMGGGRGINMQITTNDWETARFVWKNLCKDKLPNEVRDVVTWVSRKTVFEKFDPTQEWPRPPAILPFEHE